MEAQSSYFRDLLRGGGAEVSELHVERIVGAYSLIG